MPRNADPLSRKTLHQALKCWRNTHELGEHELSTLRIVENSRIALGYDASPTGYGLAVRAVLRAGLEALRPGAGEPDSLDKRWRPYILLKERYIHDRSPDSIAEQMGIARSTYDHTQNAAIEALLDILREKEETAAQSTASSLSDQLGVPPFPRVPFLAPPRMPHSLVGRDDLLELLRERLLAGASRVALHGLPGVGKTALAIYLCSHPDISGFFSDGVMWAGLGRTPNLLGLLGSWGMALGLSTNDLSRLSSLEDRARTLRALIGSRSMLLVIDDVWRIEDSMAFLVGGLNCAYLLTTRQPHIAIDFAGEGTIHVPELDHSTGQTLLAQFVPELSLAEPGASRQLVEAASGLPLALALIGQYLRKESRIGHARRLRAAVERLQNTEERLRLTQASSTTEQQPSLEPGAPLSLLTAIALSIEDLKATTRHALRALSVLPPKPNTFSEAAALAVTGTEVNSLDALTDAGLLEATSLGRYALHSTISEYARLHLADQPDAGMDALKRMVAYFVPLIEEQAQSPAESHVMLDVELDNMLASLEAAFALQDWSALIRGANKLNSSLEARGLYHIAEKHLQRAEQAARWSSDIPGHVASLSNLGRIAQRYGDYVRAENLFAEGLLLARSLDDAALLSEVLQGLGVVAISRGEYAKAAECFQESLDLAHSTEQPARISALLANLGTLRFSSGDYSGAEACFMEGLAIAREADLPLRICALLTNLGVLAARRGQYEAAETHFRECLSLAHTLGHRENAVFLLTNLGTLASERGNHSEAEAAYHEALLIARKLGQRAQVSHLLANLGALATYRADFEQAEVYLDEGLSLARELGHRENTILHLINLGALEVARSRLPNATPYLTEARDTARAIGHRPYMSASLNGCGELHLAQGSLAEAQEDFAEALAIARSVGVEVFVGTALYGLARASAACKRFAEARSYAEESLSVLQRIGHYRADEVRAWLEKGSD